MARKWKAIPNADKKKILDELKEKYPVLKQARPLKIGIHKEIGAENPHINKEMLHLVLRFHATSEEYLQNIITQNHRYDLKSNKITEEITEMDKRDARLFIEAKNKIKENKRLREEQKKAESQQKAQEIQP